MAWTVKFHPKVAKVAPKLPEVVQDLLRLLVTEMELSGPVRGKWPNYGKLSRRGNACHHCHLKKGRPTYVAVWEVNDASQRIMEVVYVGTHANAPY